MSDAFDICVIGSGAGGGPVATVLAEAGYSVVVLEKGPAYDRRDFFKDEIVQTRRHMFVPPKRHDPHVWEKRIDGRALAWQTQTGWNAVCVGGASNIMSGYFLRMKPVDFRQHSRFGARPGAAVTDWPISYEAFSPYYERVENEVGVSGHVVAHPQAEPRAGEIPHPPLSEHPIAQVVDATGHAMGLHPFPEPRAILPYDEGGRHQCNYSGYCGSYGCTTDAKGSSRVALLPRALATGRTQLRARCAVQKLESDRTGRVVAAVYRDARNEVRRVRARIFVVACSAIESARLLLLSDGPRHPNGLANGRDLVGRHLLFSTFGAASGEFRYADHEGRWPWMRSDEPFVNRAIQDYYEIADPALGTRKGGTLSFLLDHPNPVQAAFGVATRGEKPIFGADLKRELARYFKESVHLRVEVFGDYTPMPEGRVMLDPDVKDRWGRPVARARVDRHPDDLQTAEWLVARGKDVLERMGASRVREEAVGESTNLVGGTCRFGTDPATSVLDADCRAHEVDNLYVTDGSFLPSGGSVPFTFTIYANAFRVADRIVARLGGRRAAPPLGGGPLLPRRPGQR